MLTKDDGIDNSISATALAVMRVRGCRYPFGRPRSPAFQFCNAPRRWGSMYCSEHSALCEMRR